MCEFRNKYALVEFNDFRAVIVISAEFDTFAQLEKGNELSMS